MPKSWKQAARSEAQLPSLTVAELEQRLDELHRRVGECLAPGMGRNPKAARQYRQQAEAVAAELSLRSDSS